MSVTFDELSAAVVDWNVTRQRFVVGSKWQAASDLRDIGCFKDAADRLSVLAGRLEMEKK